MSIGRTGYYLPFSQESTISFGIKTSEKVGILATPSFLCVPKSIKSGKAPYLRTIVLYQYGTHWQCKLFLFHNIMNSHNSLHAHSEHDLKNKYTSNHNYYLIPMSSEALASATRATTRSRSHTIAGGVEHQPEQTTSSPSFGFVTPTRFVARHEFSKSLESPPRKKHRSNVSSSFDFRRVTRNRTAGPTVSNLDFVHDDAAILARFDLSNVPNNEFILATPNQVGISFEVEYPTYMDRPRTVSISRNDADTDSLADSEEIFGFLEGEHRDSPRPPSSGRNPAMTTIQRMFLPIGVEHLESNLSELHMTDTRGYGLRLKPRPKKRTAHHGTTPWDPEFTI
jgi:hypothetical protein